MWERSIFLYSCFAANLLFGRLSTSIVVCGPGPYSWDAVAMKPWQHEPESEEATKEFWMVFLLFFYWGLSTDKEDTCWLCISWGIKVSGFVCQGVCARSDICGHHWAQLILGSKLLVGQPEPEVSLRRVGALWPGEAGEADEAEVPAMSEAKEHCVQSLADKKMW